jgi:hypothetical protein
MGPCFTSPAGYFACNATTIGQTTLGKRLGDPKERRYAKVLEERKRRAVLQCNEWQSYGFQAY